MFKSDRKAAYEKLPSAPLTKPRPSRPCATHRKTDGMVLGTRAMIFGSIADVLHYNVLPRILTAVVNRYLGIPMAG